MPSLADLIKSLNKPRGRNILDKLEEQSFRPGDSVIASTINHPIDAVGRGLSWLNNQVNTAVSPYASSYQQIGAANNLAGLAQLGSMPMAPASRGGVLGTLTGMADDIPETEYSRAHKIAQQNAVEMLGLPPDNTAMDRARSMGFDIDNRYYHATNSSQDWSVFDPNKAPSGEGVMFAADDPGAASWFAPGNNSRVMPVLLNKKNYGEKVNLNGDFEAQIYENFLKKIKEDEIDFAIFNNVNDPIPIDKLVMAKQPSNNFRSLFAAFDPAKKDSADLLASWLLPATMLGAGMYGEKQNKRSLSDLLGYQ